jgi:lysylphosphatidylglycerol synthetase-like protein (DUF2156 family)
MKKELSSFFVLLTSVGFASATGLDDLLNSIDETMIILLAVFIVSFCLLFFSLNKVFKKENTTMSGIIAVVISFLIVYGVSKSGFSIENSLYGIGISQEALGIVIPLIIVAGMIFLIVKLKKDSLLAIGGLLILLSFFVYAKTLFIVVGVIMGIIWLFLRFRKGGNSSGGSSGAGHGKFIP